MEHTLCAFAFQQRSIDLEDLQMDNFLSKAVFAGILMLLVTNLAAAQTNPYKASQELAPAAKASSMHIRQGPTLELATSNSAIIRWTSNNPGGTDEHFGVVTYGTDKKNLNAMAKSHIRLNRNHSYTVFRVRVDGLQPQTTYYYTVNSMEGDGTRDGVRSSVRHFTTR